MRWCLFSVLLIGCSSPTSGGDPPIDMTADMRAPDVGASDLREIVDVGLVDAETPDVGVAQDIGCGGSCRTLALTADVAGTEAAFDRAYYGLTHPTMSTSGAWEVYIEVYRGGEEGCPSETSATPDQTVIIAGLPVSVGAVTEADGLSVVMLDFEGLLTTEPILRATAEQATVASLNVCTDCPSVDDADGYVALELTAPLDNGAIDGHVFATHCQSLDTAAAP